MVRLCSLICVSSLTAAVAADVMFFESPGFEEAHHTSLKKVLSKALVNLAPGKQFCVAHGSDGADSVSNSLSTLTPSSSTPTCDAGVALLGAAPMPEVLEKINGRVLVIGAELDGFVPFSHFAVARHRATDTKNHHFALLRDASHASFLSGVLTQAVLNTDLQATASEESSFKQISEIIHDFVKGGGDALSLAEARAKQLATPVVDALKLEGSLKLGHVACNSDWPTNPTCKYPKYPDHSLPFGPAPAPSPPLPSDCICGSPWVMQSAAIAYDSPGPYSSFTNDAFQDVSDVHPFHLPHIFNKCSKPDASCVLNATTVTMPVQKAGDLWPQGASAPLSVFEFKTKFKSREAFRTSANDPTASPNVDKVSDMCKKVNQAALDWALNHAEPSVKARYEKSGEPMVMVDDVEAAITIKGPSWITDEIAFKRVSNSSSPTGTQIEVQSKKFVVGNTHKGDVPWFFPVGMHYCKLLSPARAMEWIYTDSQRHAAKQNTVVV